MDQRSVRIVGNLLVVVALLLGLAGAGLLYQWERGLQASLAEETPMENPSPSSGPPAVAGSAQNATPTATAGTPPAGEPLPAEQEISGGNPASGKALYGSLCNACHPGGRAGMGPALTNLDEKTLAQAVRQGKGAMPAFPEDGLSEAQLSDIIAYIKTIK